ncbi:MAG TPA: M14 metallopeptidase family protein [Gemmatimonadota bacterium]|nr:M14 metallopeptidase family protein [Gemmatimonadota bacterium]
MKLRHRGRPSLVRLARAAALVLLASGLALPRALAAQVRAPAPKDVFGFEPGADYHLATYEQVSDYFSRLAAASDRVALDTIGRSVDGRPLLLAFISSAENLGDLERYRSISEHLARGDVPDSTARRMAAEGKAVVWIDGGLHATEVAHGQETPLLAYRVATDTTSEMRRIRRDVITLVMPNLNPDGLDIVASWYERNLHTPFETAPLPWLYHRYVGHDNNRDWFTMFMPETRAVARVLYEEWYPQIVYNQHQPAPFPARIFTPPFADPVNPDIPPLVVRGVNAVGDAMNRRFQQEGKSGVVSRVGFDMWWNGGMRTAPYFHNMVGLLTETALFRYATPHYYPPDSLPKSFGRQSNLSAVDPSVFYPDPWQGGWWRLRDAMNYEMTSDLATLDIGSRRRGEWLYDAYRMARDAIETGQSGHPFAWVIGPDQRNPREAVELVNILRRGGVDVRRSEAAFTAGDHHYPAGSYVVYAGQAFRPYVVDLLEKQVYPDRRLYPGGPPDRPYDITGWTLPMQMDVDVERVDDPFQARTAAVDSASVRPGKADGGAGWGWLLSHGANASAIATNRLLAAGDEVSWTAAPVRAGGTTWPAGTITVRSGDGTPGRVASLARELGLDFTGIGGAPEAALTPLRRPRVALYKPWTANIDEGWTRWILERYGFAFDTLHDADIRGGALDRYDALILPDQDPEDILSGHAPGTMPEKYVGGLGTEGAAAIDRFVRGGGTLIALDESSDFAIAQLGLPVRDATRGWGGDSFFIPGSLIRVSADSTLPTAYGMPASTAAFFSTSRAFRIIPPASAGKEEAARPPVSVPVRYARDDLLMSGWALGESRLAGLPAVVRVRHGKGEVVLVGFRAQFRAQPRGTFKLLFNAIQGAGRSSR